MGGRPTEYRRARELDPACQSAAVGLSASLRRLGRTNESRVVLRDFLHGPGAGSQELDAWWTYLLGESVRFDETWPALRARSTRE